MNVNIIGGGPGGLYASILLKKTHSDWDVTVYERNPQGVTYGWGIVFPDRTISNLAEADAPSHRAITENFERWDPFDIRYGDERYRCGGNTFASMMRTDLLTVLQDRCRDVGVDLQFETTISEPGELAAESDLCIFADGIHSRSRDAFADEFGTDIVEGEARFSWFGTEQDFEALTHIFVENDDGIWCAHTYPSPTSTFIVDCDAETWERSGLEQASESEYLSYLEDVFADHLGGHSLLSQQDQWRRFETVTNERWHHDNMVLLGDAAHTAHYSIGSGTTLAMEDAIGLMETFESHDDIERALSAYEASRRPFVDNLLSAAERSRIHFEKVARYYDLPPRQFAVHHLTRSGRLTYGSLKRRDPSFVQAFDEWFARTTPGDSVLPPAYQPLDVGGTRLENRFVRPLETTFSAVDGTPSTQQLSMVPDAAADGPGLVLTEPLAVAPDARRTTGSPGLYTEEHTDAWADVLASVPADVTVGTRLLHAGAHGGVEAQILESGGYKERESTWAPRLSDEYPVRPAEFAPDALSSSQREAVVENFSDAARRAADAGFEYLQIDGGTDSLFGDLLALEGSLDDRTELLRDVVSAVSQSWPDSNALGVTIPVSGAEPTGISMTDAFEIADRLATVGCDVVAPVDAQRGSRALDQSGPSDFSDDLRNETGISTIATAPTTSVDKVNTLVATGRADLCLFPRRVPDQ
ncbi:FAD-dependent monooxygenase [Halobellus salinisoli]|uniref:oxidoreductase n=1 Tax=Halobellus salinisoli TaxID=3108500 RepID=UPI00300B074D